jgi:hypothetical protein
LKNIWGLQVPGFSLLAIASLGDGCPAFLVHEKDTRVQEGLGFLFVATNLGNGRPTFLIHERNTQVQKGLGFFSLLQQFSRL